MSWTSQRSRSVTKTTLSDLLPPTNTDTTTEQEKLSPVQMPQLPACYNALTCRACHWQLLITSRWGDSLWSTANTHTQAHGRTHLCTQTSLIKCACVQTQMCTRKPEHTHTHATHTHTLVCISLHLVATQTRKLREKNNHLKALIRIWTVTRLVHKLGEIWVGITIWQPAVRHQTSSVISIFSHDSELCDKQYHAASQSVSPSTGNVAN